MDRPELKTYWVIKHWETKGILILDKNYICLGDYIYYSLTKDDNFTVAKRRLDAFENKENALSEVCERLTLKASKYKYKPVTIKHFKIK